MQLIKRKNNNICSISTLDENKLCFQFDNSIEKELVIVSVPSVDFRLKVEAENNLFVVYLYSKCDDTKLLSFQKIEDANLMVQCIGHKLSKFSLKKWWCDLYSTGWLGFFIKAGFYVFIAFIGILAFSSIIGIISSVGKPETTASIGNMSPSVQIPQYEVAPPQSPEATKLLRERMGVK